MLTVSPQWTLLAGIVLSFFFANNEWIQTNARIWGSRLLQFSVVLLGASLNFNAILKQGAAGVIITLACLIFIIILGLSGQKIFGIDRHQGILITIGTAICGGSAMGAMAPILGADAMAITISFGVVFILNAFAVFIFPPLGEYFLLSQEQFGTWAALAIHDTSSVVAASSIFGVTALETATTLKLTRALWIIPMTIIFSLIMNKEKKRRVYIPWFIFGFLGMSLLFTFLAEVNAFRSEIVKASKLGFALTLFLIGLTFNLKKIRKLGAKPFLFGTGLWLLICGLSLIYVRHFHKIS